MEGVLVGVGPDYINKSEQTAHSTHHPLEVHYDSGVDEPLLELTT